MWKRWSFNSVPTKDVLPAGDKTRSQSHSAGADHVPALESSLKPETVAEDASGEVASSEAAETAAPVVQTTDANHVASDTPVNSTAVVVSSDSVKDLPTEQNNPVPSTDGSLPLSPHAVSSFESTPRTEGGLTPANVLPAAAGISSDVISSTHSESTDFHDTPTQANTLPVPQQEQPVPRPRRLSFRSIAFFYGSDKNPPTTSPTSPSVVRLKATLAGPVGSKPRSPPKTKLSRSDKQALSSALALRTLIIGPVPQSSAPRTPHARHAQNKLAHPPPSLDLKKVKSHLLKPKSANAVIAQLRRLPLPDGPTVHASAGASSESLVTHPDAGGTPIHAVCLACTDEEADRKYFSRLSASHSVASSLSPPSGNKLSTSTSSGPFSVATASLESLVDVLKDLQLVSLLTSPDLGFGQPVGEHNTGPLTGSVPSAGAIITGFEEVTKQLMSLGFATSKAVFPSHAGIYPPVDRMSVLTYWWGLELVMPEPSVKYLGNVKSISHAVLNFLSAVSLFNNGVREVLPFIRYIANFVDFEWSAIQSQDRGKGVVCAATWVMPAAMVPRPWDFPSRPASKPDPSNVPTASTPAPLLPTPVPAPAPVPDNDTDGDKKPVLQPPQETHPAIPPGMPYPPAPTMPILPMLTVTPATLPRGTNPPQVTA